MVRKEKWRPRRLSWHAETAWSSDRHRTHRGASPVQVAGIFFWFLALLGTVTLRERRNDSQWHDHLGDKPLALTLRLCFFFLEQLTTLGFKILETSLLSRLVNASALHPLSNVDISIPNWYSPFVCWWIQISSHSFVAACEFFVCELWKWKASASWHLKILITRKLWSHSGKKNFLSNIRKKLEAVQKSYTRARLDSSPLIVIALYLLQQHWQILHKPQCLQEFNVQKPTFKSRICSEPENWMCYIVRAQIANQKKKHKFTDFLSIAENSAAKMIPSS